MRITVANARALAASLVSGADAAEKSGSADFELISSLQALDDEARADLQAAIEAASH